MGTAIRIQPADDVRSFASEQDDGATSLREVPVVPAVRRAERSETAAPVGTPRSSASGD
jgi:hypothetical protein